MLENIGFGGRATLKKIFVLFLFVLLLGCNDADTQVTNGEMVNEKFTVVEKALYIEEENIIKNLIVSEKWEEAKQSLEQAEFKNINNYNELYSYVGARYDYITEKNNGKVYYEPILKKLNVIDLDTYNGDFKEEMIEFKESFNKERLEQYDKVSNEHKENQNKLYDQREEKRWKDIASYLKEENYDEVLMLVVSRIKTSIDDKAVYNYSQSQISRLEGDKRMMMYFLEDIPMDYNGQFSDLILKRKLSLQSKGKWDQAVKKRNEINELIEQDNQKREQEKVEIIEVSPKIGMTADAIRGSTWGSPKEIIKNTSRYGVYEQWVYSGNRYIFFEDGIVTDIYEQF
jgi:hypothetical protein